MIKFDVKINMAGLKKDIEDFESRVVRVDVNPKKPAWKPDFKKGLKNMRRATGGGTDKPLKALYVGKRSRLKMTELAMILDAEYGVFSKGPTMFADADLDRVIQELSSTFGADVDATQQRRVENACVAMVTNPIINKKYGSNSREWAMRKKFNLPMVATGSFISAIRGTMLNV